MKTSWGLCRLNASEHTSDGASELVSSNFSGLKWRGARMKGDICGSVHTERRQRESNGSIIVFQQYHKKEVENLNTKFLLSFSLSLSVNIPLMVRGTKLIIGTVYAPGYLVRVSSIRVLLKGCC